jgi:parvulin-like peptidyl-prolyl isomerase
VSYKGAQGPGAERTKEEAKTLSEKVLAEAGAGGDFDALSHKHSDDEASDAQGGFLGVFDSTRMTPAFQAAVEKAAEGAFAPVTETEFGFHVIQRLSLAQGVERLARSTRVFTGIAIEFGERTRPKAEALEAAKKAVAHLRAGKALEDLPTECFAAPIQPGFVPMVLRRGAQELRPEYRSVQDAAFAMAEGDVSEPLETPRAYWVIRRTAYFRAHAWHLIVMYRGSRMAPPGTARTKEEAKARASEALAKVRADPASWSKVVAEYSEEPGAASRAGYLGLVEPSTSLVKEFLDPLARMAPGTVSDVVETAFGFHVIRRGR